jgi:hypothetical protein
VNRRDFLASTASCLSQLAGAAQSTTAEPDYARLLARHDIVYLSPTEQKSESLPVGNGDLVGMVSMCENGLDVVVNKANLWDDRPDDPPLAANWAWDIGEEERWTSIVSGCRVHIRSPLPVLAPLYLDDFEARLKLYEATVQTTSSSPLGSLNATTWVSATPPVLVIDYDENSPEPIEREIELQRWGSRRLFHWYSQYDPKATSTGLDGTQAEASGDYISIRQRLRAISFAVVARFVGTPVQTHVRSRHSAVIRTTAAARLVGQLYLSIATSEESPDPLAAARRNVDEAVSLGRDTLLSAHRKTWAAFWSKSFVSIPQDYLENLYYFNLYQLASSSRGAYPPTHCGGLWFWDHDIRRWGHYYHWNVQQQYWPVHAANHAELAMPYFEFRRKTLPEAEKYARAVHNRGGAFYSDVTDRTGRGTVHQHVMYIMTAGPQIAMDLWRHYLYTQDREFLRTHAYPVMKATAEFYLEIVERGDDGHYHVPRSTGYENFIEQRDTISDLAMIRQHFPACIRASEILNVDPQLRPRLAQVVENLAPFSILDAATDEDGKKLPPVFSSGLPLMDAKIGPDRQHHWTKQRTVKKGERQFNISFYVENAPVFPSGVIGLNQRGTQTFQVAVNTALSLGSGPAWNSLPAISMARLGHGDDCLRLLTDLVERFQRYPQGYFAELTELHEMSGNRFDMSTPFRLINGKRTERGKLPGSWFDYPDLELGGVLMTAINEMLLQSHDGIIRVFPAIPAEWRQAAFRLCAVGAFIVTGEMRGGEIQPYLIESLAGSKCDTELPWENATVKNAGTGKIVTQGSGRVSFATVAGSRYLVFRTGGPETPPQSSATPAPNRAPKQWRDRRIGIPREF